MIKVNIYHHNDDGPGAISAQVILDNAKFYNDCDENEMLKEVIKNSFEELYSYIWRVKKDDIKIDLD